MKPCSFLTNISLSQVKPHLLDSGTDYKEKLRFQILSLDIFCVILSFLSNLDWLVFIYLQH